MSESKLMKRPEVAELLGIDVRTLDSYEADINSGFPRSRKIGGTVFYSRDEIEQFLMFSQTQTIVGTQEVLDDLTELLLARAINSLQDRTTIFGAMQPELFVNEYYILYYTMYLRKGQGGDIDEQYLNIFLDRNREMILDNKNVDTQIYQDSEDDIEVAYINSVLKTYHRLKDLDYNKEDDLALLIDKYLAEFKHLRGAAILNNGNTIMFSGMKQGRKQMIGFDTAAEYIRTETEQLESLVSRDLGRGLMLGSEVGLIDDISTEQLQIGDFGDLTFLTELYNGIRTGMFYSLLAPPKSGKSKFMFRLAYISMTKYKQNVLFWPREGGPNKLLAELRMIHFDETYNKNLQPGQQGFELSAQEIMHNNFPSEEIKELEALSRNDLYGSGNYGQICIIDKDLELETFEDIIKQYVSETGATSIYIDYLQLIRSRSVRASKSETIGTAYQRALTLIKDLNIALFTPGQYKQEAVKELGQGLEVDTRVAAGESAEVVRTPDVNMALYGSPEEMQDGQLRMLSIPSRDAEGFEPTEIFVDFRTNYFSEVHN